MRNIILVLAVLVSGCSHNHTIPEWNANDEVALQCHDAADAPIHIVNVSKADNVFGTPSARYNIEKQRREIVMPEYINGKVYPNSIMEFIAYHECAHHQLSHIKVSAVPQIRNMWGDKEMQEEKDADVFAVEVYFKRHGEQALHKLQSDLQESHLISLQRMTRLKRVIRQTVGKVI